MNYEDVTILRDLVVSFIVGSATGIVFAVMRLPVPAPVTLSGVIGILGLFVGYKLVHWLL